MPTKKNFTITTPTTIVIFGVTGDLAQKKLLPALFDLHRRGVLPSKFHIVGFARREWSDEQFREFATTVLKHDRHHHTARELTAFLRKLTYARGNFDTLADYQTLKRRLVELDKKFGQNICSNKLLHLAVPPEYYPVIFKNLSHSGLSIACVGEGEGWTRLLVEKPFGRDSATARNMDAQLGALFDESQIFRIDHYLAKETIQNILTFRFSNSIFEPVWNARYVERVEIELFEAESVAHRINFFDGVGELRDVVQSHALQMLALVAMEQPQGMGSAAIRRERERVMRSLALPAAGTLLDTVVRAQYRGYADDVKNAPAPLPSGKTASQTETFVQIKTQLKSRRWRGVPFYITAGKALHRSKVKIKVYFKQTKGCFNCPAGPHEHPRNLLVFRIQPQEGIAVHFWAKRPGFKNEMVSKELRFDYHEFSDAAASLAGSRRERIPDAYETLLFRAMRGEQTNFASSRELAASWRYITAVLKHWKQVPLQTYQKGGKGPKNLLLKINN
ncbi:MAG: glucose-6-phosphate dehydrogenase [bacterium]|nr:glucose-6-phosphate dehydrogenase [bacterium]